VRTGGGNDSRLCSVADFDVTGVELSGFAATVKQKFCCGVWDPYYTYLV
jgi:hypothetical protein